MPAVTSSRRSRVSARLAVGAAALMLLASTILGSALPAVAADPFQRQADDPIVVAREQRKALEARIAQQHDRITQLDAASARLDAALQRTTDSLAKLSVNLDELRAAITQAVTELADAEARRDDLQRQVETLDWSLITLGGQADELAADLDQRRRELGSRLAEAWRAGKTSLWEQVFSSGSFLDGVLQQQGALALGERDVELARSIQNDQALLDEQRLEMRHLRYDTETLRTDVAARAVKIAAGRDKLVVAQVRLAELEAQTAALKEEQQKQLAILIQNRAKAAALLKEHQKEAKQLSQRIGKLLDKERHSGRLPSAFNSTFRWPFDGDVQPFITQEFGCTGWPMEPPYKDCPHFHQGIDIALPIGTPVRAPADGIVLFVGFVGYDTAHPMSDPSYTVVIAHSDHLYTVYGHLQPRTPTKIRAGVRVRPGQVIGFEGNTGHSTGPHLHWGVFLDDVPVNPRFFI